MILVSAAGRARLRRFAGAGFVLMSVVSIVLSLGAPGLGWVLATVTMIVVSLCAHLVGWRWLSICLAVTLLHLVTLGPLSDSAGSSFGNDWLFGVVFAAAPLVVGVVALIVTYWRSRTGQ